MMMMIEVWVLWHACGACHFNNFNFLFFSVFIELQEGIKGGREDLSVSVSVWIRSVFLLRCL